MKIFYIALFLLLPSIGNSQNACLGLDSINYSGQWYHTVQIGSQCWLKENLNVGNMVPAVKDQINNDTIEKFCYNNDPSMCDVYGGLYQWREAMQYTLKEKARGICPIGWHIPSNSDFDNLISAVGNDGNALKQIGQGAGTNTSGFSAMLSGINEFTSFYELGSNTYLLSSSSIWVFQGDFGDGVPYADYTTITNGNPVFEYYTLAEYGLNIRCLKDNDGLMLQSPYGGESWQVGSSHKISWGGTLDNKKLKIDYTTDNGITWLQIIDSTSAADGDYSWIIPNSPSKNCRVRISDISIPQNLSISDNVFTIYKDPCPAATIEHGGKIYKTVVVNGRCWLKENISIGSMIPGIQQATANGIIEKYCYNDDTANCTIYGGLYSYSETGEPGFCPTFWHKEGIDYLIGSVIYDANALKEVGQGTGFGSGSNISGFSALLAGYRATDGSFQNLGGTAYFPNGAVLNDKTYLHYLSYGNSNIAWTDHWLQTNGSSYRCVKDAVSSLSLKSPVGGENWQIGTTQKITWYLSEVINIKIDYTTDGGSSWINIITSTPTSAGSYNWTIPNTPSTNCKVKISSTNSPDTNSISNVFSIYQIPINPCPGIPTVNYAGQTYNTIAIGDKCWLKENLNIGTMINVTQDPFDNGIIEKYCYDNDSINCSIYGGLYQWDEAMQYTTVEGAKGICPSGWHIPTWTDLTTLKTNVNNNGNDLKEVGQGSGSGTGTNASGFSALLAGISYNHGFYYLNNHGDWWTSKIYDSISTYGFQVASSTDIIQSGPVDIMAGYNIRCINDLTTSELPVELISFIAALNDDNVLLNWKTATEVNTLSFDMEKKTSNNNSWQKIASVKASGNSTSPKQYSYIDKNIHTGKYNYRLKIVGLDGSFTYSNIVEVGVAAPSKFELGNAYPNPFNPTTTIRYKVPVNILISIKLFDALGREVTFLVNEIKPAGNYEVTLNGRNLSSGIYYYQMRAGDYNITKKVVLLK